MKLLASFIGGIILTGLVLWLAGRAIGKGISAGMNNNTGNE